MTDDKLASLSYDVDDFISKMLFHHRIDISILTGITLARLAKLSVTYAQEEGMLMLLDRVQETLLDSMNSRGIH